MTDRHMRILRHMARQAQRELGHHNTHEHAGDAASLPTPSKRHDQRQHDWLRNAHVAAFPAAKGRWS